MYCNRASAIEANNKIMEELEAFVIKNNITEKKPKKKINITKPTKSMVTLEEAVKCMQNQEMKTRKFPAKNLQFVLEQEEWILKPHGNKS